MSLIYTFLTFGLCASLVASTRLELVENPTAASCKTVTFSVSASAQNENFTGPIPNALNLTALGAFLGQNNGLVEVSGTYEISAQYCTPAKPHAGTPAPLLLFSHAFTSDHKYFGGLRDNPVSSTSNLTYSWIDYATKRGYYTLAIDRLGAGGSTKADAVLEVQAPLQAELYSNLISTYLTPFSSVIYIGADYGSAIGARIAANHPGLASAYILTAIAKPRSTDSSLPAILASGLEPASLYDPVRFPPTEYSLGYIVESNQTARDNLLFGFPGSFEQAIANKEFATMGTVTLGELATMDIPNASAYTGPVFVGTGMYDAIFCGNGTYTAANCGGNPDLLQGFADNYFPNARVKRTSIQPDAAHFGLLHRSWDKGVEAAHAFLSEIGI